MSSNMVSAYQVPDPKLLQTPESPSWPRFRLLLYCVGDCV